MDIIFEGKTFVQGLYGVPDSYQNKKGMDSPLDWWWEKGSKIEDNKFLYKTTATQYLINPTLK